MKDRITTGLTEAEIVEYTEISKVKIENATKTMLSRYLVLNQKIIDAGMRGEK